MPIKANAPLNDKASHMLIPPTVLISGPKALSIKKKTPLAFGIAVESSAMLIREGNTSRAAKT